jgi:hypothetical protein
MCMKDCLVVKDERGLSFPPCTVDSGNHGGMVITDKKFSWLLSRRQKFKNVATIHTISIT